jgi:hypothetical protein
MTSTANPSTLAQAMGFLGCMAIVFVAAALGAAWLLAAIVLSDRKIRRRR